MPKGIENSAINAAGTAQGQSADAYGVAAPIYQQMASDPQGYTQQQMANQTTASNQTLGGANAAAVGEGALASARTNSAGGYQAAIDDAARGAGATQSENNLDIQNQSIALQNQHQQEGLEGLSNIYGEGDSAGQGYLNTANQAAVNNPWMKILSSTLGAAGTAAPTIGKAFGV